MRENFGHAGKYYIENLPGKEALKKRYQEILQGLIESFDTTGKQAMAMALILLGDEISTDLIFKDKKLSFEDVEEYLASQKEVEQSERAYELIVDWININVNRFSSNSQSEIWGEIQDNYCLIYPSILKNFLKSQGINFDAIKKKLADEGKIIKDSQGKYQVAKTMKQSSKKERVIQILLPSYMENGDEIF